MARHKRGLLGLGGGMHSTIVWKKVFKSPIKCINSFWKIFAKTISSEDVY